jgi:TPR repeat protein
MRLPMWRWLTFVLLVCVACHRGRSSEQEQPAPSSSVIFLGVEIAACTDVPVCERECDGGSADSCRRLAASYAFGKGVEKDEGRAAALYELACGMKDPSACVFAGQMHEFARGVPKDEGKAASLYARACDLRGVAGCYNLAIMYERGSGVTADRKKAGDLYQMACVAGAKQGCDKASQMHASVPVPFFDGGVP